MKTDVPTPDAPSTPRRRLLRQGLSLPVAAVAVSALPAVAAAAPPSADAPRDAHAADGYHLSDHIREYYRLARY